MEADGTQHSDPSYYTNLMCPFGGAMEKELLRAGYGETKIPFLLSGHISAVKESDHAVSVTSHYHPI